MIWIVQEELTSSTNPIQELIKTRTKDVSGFLNPSLDQLHDPFLMKGMKEAVARLKKAMTAKEKVLISGDFDADGISSTYTMMTLFKAFGIDVQYLIPNRRDGYALSNKIIDEAEEAGCTLIITCDNGITCVDEVEYARVKGIDVVITDHHEPQVVIPNTIVINPKQADCPYPFKELAGVGVAWKTCLAFAKSEAPALEEYCYNLLEAVAIGTVADLVPLLDENRVMVQTGLLQLQHTENMGMQELFRAMGVDTTKPLTADTIGFKIGPTFNASGRLVSASEAVDALLEDSRVRAHRAANYLVELNTERKEITKHYTNEIIERLAAMPDLLDDSVLVVKHANIPEGIVGIIASRIKDLYNRPIFLATNASDGTWKGSGRSIDEYNMFEEAMEQRPHFLKVGGHPMACGFSIEEHKIDGLREALNKNALLSEEDLKPKRVIDYDIDSSLVTLKFAKELKTMEPFGTGNPKPLFLMSDVEVISWKAIGGDQTHLKLQVRALDKTFDCIGFGYAQKMQDIQEAFNNKGVSGPVWLDIAFHPGVNDYMGRQSLQLMLNDLRASF